MSVNLWILASFSASSSPAALSPPLLDFFLPSSFALVVRFCFDCLIGGRGAGVELALLRVRGVTLGSVEFVVGRGTVLGWVVGGWGRRVRVGACWPRGALAVALVERVFGRLLGYGVAGRVAVVDVVWAEIRGDGVRLRLATSA